MRSPVQSNLAHALELFHYRPRSSRHVSCTSNADMNEEHTGELNEMPRIQKRQGVLGIFLGSFVLGLIMFVLFFAGARSQGFEQPIVFGAVAGFCGAIVGAFLGPLITLAYSRRTDEGHLVKP